MSVILSNRGHLPREKRQARMPVLLLAIISNRFHRTAEQRFFTCRALFLIQRLLEDKRITVCVGAAEIFRRRITTYIAIYTGGIDVVSAGDVFLHTIVSIRHQQF